MYALKGINYKSLYQLMSTEDPSIELQTSESKRPIVQVSNPTIDNNIEIVNKRIPQIDTSDSSDAESLQPKSFKPLNRSSKPNKSSNFPRTSSGHSRPRSMGQRDKKYNTNEFEDLVNQRKQKKRHPPIESDDESINSASESGTISGILSGSGTGYEGSSVYSGSDIGSLDDLERDRDRREYRDHRTPRKSSSEIENEKRDILIKLYRYQSKGHRLTENFTMRSDLEKMKTEFAKIKNEEKLKFNISLGRKLLMFVALGSEWVNSKWNPFDIKLQGWSEHMGETLDEYDPIIERIHERYLSDGESNPILDLILAVGGSAFMFHLSQTLFKNMNALGSTPDFLQTIANMVSQQTQEQTHPPPQQQYYPPPQQHYPPQMSNNPYINHTPMTGPSMNYNDLLGDALSRHVPPPQPGPPPPVPTSTSIREPMNMSSYTQEMDNTSLFSEGSDSSVSSIDTTKKVNLKQNQPAKPSKPPKAPAKPRGRKKAAPKSNGGGLVIDI